MGTEQNLIVMVLVAGQPLISTIAKPGPGDPLSLSTISTGGWGDISYLLVCRSIPEWSFLGCHMAPNGAVSESKVTHKCVCV